MINYIIFTVLPYLLGSFNAATIISKLFYGKDIRNAGSGNAGATNTLRILGKKAAAIVFLFDFLKGFFAVISARFFVNYFNAHEVCIFTAGFLTQLGHCFPIYFKFRGGKGVATAAGAAIGIMPFVALILLAVFAFIVIISKTVSLASGICAVIYPLLAYFMTNSKLNFMFAAACSVLIIIMHASNFARLIDGNENPISYK